MAGRGRAPKSPDARRNGHAPVRGEWATIPAAGWQHGPVPDPPDGLSEASQETWRTWLAGWVAVHFTPADVPALGIVIRLYDQVQRGQYTRATELRLWLDTYGLSPKGAQDRRWAPPKAPGEPLPALPDAYKHLRVVDGD